MLRRLLLAVLPAALVAGALFAASARLVEPPSGAVSLHPLALQARSGDDSWRIFDSELRDGRLISPYCDGLRERREALRPMARACWSDADCFHYPCSCSALGINEASEELMQLEWELHQECGVPIVFAYCLSTRPVCENSQCTVTSEPRVERLRVQPSPAPLTPTRVVATRPRLAGFDPPEPPAPVLR